MPVAHDIKDAGILAGFERWGWPWHGLCQGGVIGSSGKTIPQPFTGNAWLIDKGLPALGMSPALIASEALAGREWRNYGLVSGGQVNGTELPKLNAGGGLRNASYIHVDADGINWMVTVLGTFPAVNTVRLTLSVVRFGHFKIGATLPTPVIKTVDISCQDVETTWVGPGGTWNRTGRWVDLQDVWTNGSRALLSVFMGTGAGQIAIFSAIELVLSGSGGVDGSGLAVTASEVKSRTSLTNHGVYEGVNSSGTSGLFYVGTGAPNWQYISYTCPDPAVLCLGAKYTYTLSWPFQWLFGAAATINGVAGGSSSDFIVRGYIKTYTYARLCFYDAAGAVTASRLRVEFVQDCTPDAVPSISGSTGDTLLWNDGTTTCGYSASWTVNISGYTKRGWYLLHNDTVMDKLERTTTMSAFQVWDHTAGQHDQISGCAITSSPSYTEINTDVTASWSGSLSSLLTPAMQFYDADLFGLFQFFCSTLEVGNGFLTMTDATTKYGVRRTENAAAFFVNDPLHAYGTVATALGNKAVSETGAFYFSWQRKTGEFAFSANQICYV